MLGLLNHLGNDHYGDGVTFPLSRVPASGTLISAPQPQVLGGFRLAVAHSPAQGVSGPQCLLPSQVPVWIDF